MTEIFKGIVLETFGAGNSPSYSHALLPIIPKAFENGTIITVCSPTRHSKARYIRNKFCIYRSRSYQPEAALTKLYYLFTLDLPKEKIKALMEENLR